MPEPERLTPHQTYLVTIRQIIDEAQDPQRKQQLERLYGTVLRGVPAKKLTLTASITVPEGFEAYGQSELLEYIQRLVIKDQHQELEALITHHPGDIADVPQHIWDDYDEQIEDHLEQEQTD